MKKALLIAALFAFAATASAQLKVAPKSVTAPRNNVNVESKVAIDKQKMQMANGSFRARVGLNDDVMPTAFYSRPAGSFYVGSTPEMGAYYTPYLYVPSNRNVTYLNRSTDGTTFEWAYSKYNTTTQQYDSIVGEQSNNHVQYYLNGEGSYAPTITATNSVGNASYQLYSDFAQSKANIVHSKGVIFAADNPYEDFGTGAYMSPKYFSIGVRNRAAWANNRAVYGMGIYTGAEAFPGDEEGDGYWFGTNAEGWNGMAIYCEKPESAYALKNVAVNYDSFELNEGYEGASVDIKAKVCKVAERNDSSLVLGDVLAEGIITMDSTFDETGMLVIPLMEVDEDGIEVETVLDVQDEIVVMVYGYDDPALKTWTMAISTDPWDEGFGECGYMLSVDTEGTPQIIRGLSGFFQNGVGYAAPTIFLDVEWPVLLTYFDEEEGETGEYTFPAEGGAFARDITVNGTTYPDEPLYLYSYHSSDEFIVTLENSDQAPDWLTFEFEDVEGENGFNGMVVAEVTAAPLPAGVNYREAKVDIHYPGAHLIYTFKQGEGGLEPAKTYIIGSLDAFGAWNPEAPVEMTEDEENAGVFTMKATVDGDAWFVFTEGIGSWDVINAKRFGPLDGDQTITIGEDITTQLSTNTSAAYKMTGDGSEYTITFNKNEMKFRVDGPEVEPDYVLHYGHEGVEWQDVTFVAGEGDNEGKLVAADVAFEANTQFGVKYGETWYAGLPNEGEDNYVIHYGWCTDIPLSTGDNVKNFLINEAGTYTFLLTVGEEGNTLTVNGFTAPGVLGDVTGDGEVDIADVNAIINIMLQKNPASDYPGNADVSGDGSVDIADVNAVINIMLGKV